MQVYSPDTCNCKIVFDKEVMDVIESHTNKAGKTVKTFHCPIHAEIEKKDLLQFVLTENREANKFYAKWGQSDFTEDSAKMIAEYKRVFQEIPTMIPIKHLNYMASKKAFRG